MLPGVVACAAHAPPVVLVLNLGDESAHDVLASPFDRRVHLPGRSRWVNAGSCRVWHHHSSQRGRESPGLTVKPGPRGLTRHDGWAAGHPRHARAVTEVTPITGGVGMMAR